MATVEEMSLALDTLLNFGNLRRNMIENAGITIASFDRGRLSVNEISTVVRKNAIQYRRRIEWHSRIRNDGPGYSKLIAGLSAFSITALDIEDLYGHFDGFIKTAENVPIETQGDLVSLSNTLLSQIEALPMPDSVGNYIVATRVIESLIGVRRMLRTDAAENAELIRRGVAKRANMEMNVGNRLADHRNALERIRNIRDTPATAKELTDGLVSLGIDPTDVDTQFNALTTMVSDFNAAPRVSLPQVNALSNQVLARVNKFATIWDIP